MRLPVERASKRGTAGHLVFFTRAQVAGLVSLGMMSFCQDLTLVSWSHILDTPISGRFFKLNLDGLVITFAPDDARGTGGILLRSRAQELNVTVDDQDKLVSCVLVCEFGLQVYKAVEERNAFGIHPDAKSLPISAAEFIPGVSVQVQLLGGAEILERVAQFPLQQEAVDECAEGLFKLLRDGGNSSPFHRASAWELLRVGQLREGGILVGFEQKS
jgi:hypothetical protein